MREIVRGGEQGAGFAQVRADRAVRRDELLVDHRSLAAEPQPVGAVHPRAVDCEDGIDPVRLAQQEVVLAMVRRHVDETGTRVGGDEVAGQERARLGEEAAEMVHRVARYGVGEVSTLTGPDHADIRPECRLRIYHLLSERAHDPLGKGGLKCRRDDEDLTAKRLVDRIMSRQVGVGRIEAGVEIGGKVELNANVIEVAAIGERLVDRYRPRRSGPDYCMRSAAKLRLGWPLRDLERYVDLGRHDVLIFDFGLGQRGLLDRGPHHRLGAAIELAALGELQEFAGDDRLALIVHREVGRIPVAHHPEPLELAALHGDPFLGISPAFGAEGDGIDFVLVELLRAIGFLDLPLDRQAVTVPAGHIGRVLAEQGLAAHDDVLEDLVHRMAHVNVAIRIRGAVVEQEGLAAGAGLAQLAVEPDLRPAFEDRRFLLGKAGLHGEIGLRQEDGFAIVFFVAHGSAPIRGWAQGSHPLRKDCESRASAGIWIPVRDEVDGPTCARAGARVRARAEYNEWNISRT